MAYDKPQLYARIDKEWKLLGDSLLRIKGISQTELLTSLYIDWINKNLTEITGLDYPETPDDLKHAVEAVLAYRENQRKLDAESDQGLSDYLSNLNEKKTLQLKKSLEHLNKANSLINNRLEQMNQSSQVFGILQKLSLLIDQVLTPHEIRNIGEFWSKSANPFRDDEQHILNVENKILELVRCNNLIKLQELERIEESVMKEISHPVYQSFILFTYKRIVSSHVDQVES